LLKSAPSAKLITVVHPDDADFYAGAVAHFSSQDVARLYAPTPGGETRQDSVRLGLEALARAPSPPDIVLIHDGARPFASPTLIARATEAALKHGAAVPGLALVDTVKEVDHAGRVVATPQRTSLRTVQTPQAFRFDLILDAHRRAAKDGVTGLTDDAAIAEWAGHKVHVFEGEPENMKVTSADDIALAESKMLASLQDIRMGQGFDVHAFGPGDHVWLGGVKVAHDQALLGHSDADVLMHAITDAILGAIADGDIGSHFPPSDPQWRGAASSIFLAAAAKQVRDLGGMIAHVDATLICEQPKVGPHRDAIRESLAKIIGMPVTRIAIKATTSERLGFTGREEGMAAMAVATVRLPL
jgi:2-C-methyl-D-erythritol 4-phosphate cytidylyltransferase/2-C-methyl-D-erythritol 2,4-cyclodiphosphate synthase